jgi:branched-chain amino acid transport system ATP-binding protein
VSNAPVVAPLLEVDGLFAGYGASRVLDGLDLTIGVEASVVIGRNGMGKTTLCDAIMGIVQPRAGSIRFDGVPIGGKPPERIARSGIAYVPQGRRLFPSLTVHEHLTMLARDTRGKRWTPEAVYDLFPRLAERRRNGGAELSGGEQQMLSVGRALLLNGRLVVMDEPSEGLAPTVVDDLVATIHRLVDEGVGVLVVEQNLRAATAIADRLQVMVAGRIEAEVVSDDLMSDSDLQRLYLGVDA